jgi:glycosyltransferase involved in cell wall biosynthesis
MRVLINTNYNPYAASMRVSVHEMTDRFQNAGHSVARNDWVNYADYDLILFMGKDSKVKEAKKAAPNAVVGIMSTYVFEEWQRENSRAADFLFADSIEMREKLLAFNKNVFIYYMFPEMDQRRDRGNHSSDKIVIGYHGSRTHMVQAVELVEALDALAQNYDIEFWAIYNVEIYDLWKQNAPKICKVKHIQWSDENMYEYLSKCDIGVAPGTIPISRKRALIASRFISSFRRNSYFYNPTDHMIRFKVPTNPARLYPFSRFGVPVVAEFLPSFGQFIQDGISGRLVSGKDGWYRGLETLIADADTRSSMGDKLAEYVDSNHTPMMVFERFIEYLGKFDDRWSLANS